MKQLDANTLALRNAADTAYKVFNCATLNASSGISTATNWCSATHRSTVDGTCQLGIGTYRFKWLWLKPLTDATRGAAGTAGCVIWNSGDNFINVSDGANWRDPTGAVT